jgi:hypothetical protein
MMIQQEGRLTLLEYHYYGILSVNLCFRPPEDRHKLLVGFNCGIKISNEFWPADLLKFYFRISRILYPTSPPSTRPVAATYPSYALTVTLLY